MRKLLVTALVSLAMVSVANAGIGDWWVLPIDRLDGSFTTYAGAGYNGTDAKSGSGMDGVRRVWWNTQNVYQSSGQPMPATVESFGLEFYVPQTGSLNWQPVQVQLNGYNGAINWPIEPQIPWAGQFGTNHEWIGTENGTPGTWKAANTDGPQTHAAGEIYIKDGSVLYAKWDYPWSITRSWSMIRITQLTPEPASLMLLGLGGLLLRRRSA